MKRVWLIESGDYSAYRVDCVCESEEEAQRVVDKLNAITQARYNEFFTTERWVVEADDIISSRSAEVRYPWIGSGYDFTAEPELHDGDGGWMFRQDDPEQTFEMFTRRDDEGRLRDPHAVRYRSADPERARKAAYDRMAFLRAQGEGLT